MQEWYEYAVQVAAVIVSIIGGISLVALMKGINGALGLTGKAAGTAVVIVAVILAMITALAQGLLAPGTLTPENVGILLATIYASSQLYYGKLKQRHEI